MLMSYFNYTLAHMNINIVQLRSLIRHFDYMNKFFRLLALLNPMIDIFLCPEHWLRVPRT